MEVPIESVEGERPADGPVSERQPGVPDTGEQQRALQAEVQGAAYGAGLAHPVITTQQLNLQCIKITNK